MFRKGLVESVLLWLILGSACIALYAFIIMSSMIAQSSPINKQAFDFTYYSNHVGR